MSIRARLQENPDYASLDFKNAFCTIKRDHCLTGPPQTLPAPATVVRRGREPPEPSHGGKLPRLPSTTQTQPYLGRPPLGDPMSALIFSTAMTETVNTALKELTSEVQALSYVDDTVLIGPADALSNALAQLPALLRASGIELQPPKTQVWAPKMQNLMRVPALRKLRSQMKEFRGLTLILLSPLFCEKKKKQRLAKKKAKLVNEQRLNNICGSSRTKKSVATRALHLVISHRGHHITYDQPLSSYIIIKQLLSTTLGLVFNMVAELLRASFPTTTSGMTTTTTTAEAAEVTTAAVAAATFFIMIASTAAANIIIINIITSIWYCANMAMARCTTPFQHIYNKLHTIYHHCDIDDCIFVTSAGSPSSSTSASVATDNCDPVENVAFYINMMAHPNTRLPMPTSFDGNTPPFLEWTSEVRGFLQLNDFGFLVNLDTAVNEVNPVSLNDIYTARDDTEAIDRGITQHNEGLAALNEELAQRDQPIADGQPRRAAAAINTDIANVNGQRDALIAQRNTIKRDITRASQYLTYIMVHTTKPNSEVNNMVRQLQRSENGFEIWRQLRQRFSGGQRAQQLQLPQRIMNPKWTEAQQGQQFNQWLIDISRYELETATPIEESIKIATAINNLRGAVRQHLLLSVRPTTTW